MSIEAAVSLVDASSMALSPPNESSAGLLACCAALGTDEYLELAIRYGSLH
jgi:hypothetical protein